MEKLLFLVPNVDVAREVLTTLREHGVSEEHVGVIANSETRIEDLPEADPTDDSDVLPAFARGVAAGGATGLLAGLAAMIIAPAGIAVGGAALATAALGGASFGAFASALVGTSVPNSQLREYEDAIKRGEILMIVEVEDDEAREAEIRNALTGKHPSLSVEGTKGVPPAI